ncbi:unnamed protein product [Arctogadus glacialis]
MNLTSAARGFLALLLSVPVLQGNGDWTVTYSSSNVCALRGAMVDINCTYEYPDNVQYRPNTVRTLWFSKGDKYQPVDLKNDTDYRGRVESICGEVSCTGSRCHGTCTLRIKDLRQSDSDVYKFRFTTNQPGGEYTGDPGVTLSLTDLQVKLSFPHPTDPTWTELECHSMCDLAGDPRYTWYRNGDNVGQGVNYRSYIQHEGSYSCAVEGYERLHSPLVYAPKTPSVTVSPSGEIKEGSSVTLSCSSDANPAATYTWFRLITDHSSRETKQGQYLVFRSILSSDSGQYYCLAQTELRTKSELIYITVKYAPKTPSVTVSPSGEIEEGSSVTLSCSSDANPAAEYTWFKDNQPLLWGPSQPLTFPSVRPADRGTYRCHAENQYGQLSSNSIFMDVQYAPKTPSVTMSPSGEIEEGSSVTLSCSSDANPAATYTWFRVNTGRSPRKKNQGPQLVFNDILSSDSGKYRCEAQNTIGKRYVDKTIDVKYAPKTPSVTVSPSGAIKEGSSVTLSCSSDANPVATYTWFRDITDRYSIHMNQGPQLIISYIWSSNSGQYRCDATNKLGKKSVTKSIDVIYAPKNPSVTVSPSGEIEEGSSVTLSCSSDANPAATYTWFKVNRGRSPRYMNQGPQLVFNYIVFSDSGQYRCGPKHTSLLSSPSGEIEEGSSVTLSCSSDANPAAEYTWFKNNQPLLWGPSQPHTFPSVRPEDRGTYRCHAENQYGQLSSNLIFLNVTYAPKTPSVTVSPSGEIEEGSSATLSCSSDANPAANYTWFREHEDSVKASGQNYSITNITSELGGNYYCQAHNAIGHHNSTFLIIKVTSSSHPAMVAVTTIVVLLATILLLVLRWMRRKRASSKAGGQGERPVTVEEPLPVSITRKFLAVGLALMSNQTKQMLSFTLWSTLRDQTLSLERVTRQRRQKPQSCIAPSKNTPDIERVVAAGFK